MHILDVPIVIARWAIHESLSSVRYLEKRWGALYRNQCGQSWHTASALKNGRFLRSQWPELERRATSVIVSAMWFYAFHITHVSCRITWQNGTESTLASAPASELLMSLSELTDDIDTGRIVAIDAFAAQNHVREPTLLPEHVGDDLWLQARVASARDAPQVTRNTFPNANHCLYRPVLVRLTQNILARRTDIALDRVIARLLKIAILVQRDGDTRHALVSVRSASMEGMNLWDRADRQQLASGWLGTTRTCAHQDGTSREWKVVSLEIDNCTSTCIRQIKCDSAASSGHASRQRRHWLASHVACKSGRRRKLVSTDVHGRETKSSLMNCESCNSTRNICIQCELKN